MNKKIAIMVQDLMDGMPYYSDLDRIFFFFFFFLLKSCPNVLWQKSTFKDGKIYIFIFSNLEQKFTFPSVVNISHKPRKLVVVLVTFYPIEILAFSYHIRDIVPQLEVPQYCN